MSEARGGDTASLDQDLAQALEQVARKHGVEPEALRKRLAEQRFSERLYRKGGLVLVDPGVYLAPDEPHNTLVLDAGKRWTGAARGEQELALVQGGEVVGSLRLPRHFDPRKALFAWFSGRGIHYVDGARLAGGAAPALTEPPAARPGEAPARRP